MNKDLKKVNAVLQEVLGLLEHTSVIKMVLNERETELGAKIKTVEKALKAKATKLGENEAERLEKTLIDAKIILKNITKASAALTEFCANVKKAVNE